MPKVRILRPTSARRRGDEVDMGDKQAKEWVARGLAEVVETPKKKMAQPKTEKAADQSRGGGSGEEPETS